MVEPEDSDDLRDSGGYVVPAAFIDDLTQKLMFGSYLYRPGGTRRMPTWEERLAEAIKERTLRNRWRRLRRGWRDQRREARHRLALAKDALAGEDLVHYRDLPEYDD